MADLIEPIVVRFPQYIHVWLVAEAKRLNCTVGQHVIGLINECIIEDDDRTAIRTMKEKP